jgi:hypothetical protein
MFRAAVRVSAISALKVHSKFHDQEFIFFFFFFCSSEAVGLRNH